MNVNDEIKQIIKNTVVFKHKDYPNVYYHMTIDIRNLKLNRILNTNYEKNKSLIFSIHRIFNPFGFTENQLWIHEDTVDYLTNKYCIGLRHIFVEFKYHMNIEFSECRINKRPQKWYKENGFF